MTPNEKPTPEILNYVPAYVLLLNLDGTITWVNTHALNEFDLEREDVIGKSITNIFGEDQAKELLQQISEIFTSRTPIERVSESITIPKLGCRWFYTHKSPVGDNVLMYMVDITDNITDIIAKVE